MAALVLAAAALTGCTGGSSPDPAPGQRTPTAGPSPSPVAMTVTHSMSVNGVLVDVEVGPVAVADGLGVLRLAAPNTAPHLALDMWDVFVGTGSVSASGVRLVDLEAGTVSLPTPDEHGVAASGSGSPGGPATDAAQAAAGEGVEILYTTYTAPTGSTVDVVLTQGGVVHDVPVVDAADAGELTVPVSEITDDVVTAQPVATLESFTAQAGGAVRTRETQEQVQVELGSDVLFAVDSDQLGPDAGAALAAVAARIESAPGGALTIVGHTDDVLDEGYNQALSERRARSVADGLAGLVALTRFDVTVTGVGESEPAVDDTSDSARALNRRVTLTFAPAREPAEATPVEGQVPDATGPVASGTEPVQAVVSWDGDTFSVAAQEVRRVGRFLVGQLLVTSTGTEEPLNGGALTAGAFDPRGTFVPRLQAAANNVTLLVGDTRFYPVDYLDGDRRDVLADRNLNGIEPGTARVVTVVWGDPGGDTVIIDAPGMSHVVGGTVIDDGGAPFRLTDVPVTEG